MLTPVRADRRADSVPARDPSERRSRPADGRRGVRVFKTIGVLAVAASVLYSDSDVIEVVQGI